MQKLKFGCVGTVLALVAGIAAISADANAGERPVEAGTSVPPLWVLEALESGEAPVVPKNGPPAWVVEAWQNGERPQRPAGPPPWIASRHAIARQLGLPGPPPEVIDAWQNGDGADLPGPPEFVFEWFGF